jgi:hypothetical protein
MNDLVLSAAYRFYDERMAGKLTQMEFEQHIHILMSFIED